MSKERELLSKYVSCRNDVDHLKSTLSDKQAELRECESLLRQYMDSHDVESTAKYEDLGRFSLGNPVVNVKFDKEHYPIDRAINWLKDNGYADSVQETIHHATLGAIVRNAIKEGERVPDFFVTSTYRPSNYQRS